MLVIERPSVVFYDVATGCNIALASWKDKHLLVSYILGSNKEAKIITLFVLSKSEEIVRKREKSDGMDKNKPEIRYDQDSDILYIKINESSVDNTIDVAQDVFVENDKNGNMIGIEIWQAKQLLLNPLTKHNISKQVRLGNKGR